MKTLREILITLIVAVAVFFLLQITIQSSVVVGSSMNPTLEHGQRLLVNKLAYKFHPPERGDVIVFRSPNNQRTEFVKRVIAVPSDNVEVKSETVYVNGTQLYEPYIAAPPHYALSEQEVPQESYFVLGDNRNNSNDSHKGWTVPYQNIIGKAWLSIWPPDKWGTVPNYDLEEQVIESTGK